MRLPMNTSLATLKPSGIRRINCFCLAAPGIPGEKLKRIGPQGQRRPAHSQKALRRRQVASCVQHPAAPLHSRRAAQSTLPSSRVMTP